MHTRNSWLRGFQILSLAFVSFVSVVRAPAAQPEDFRLRSDTHKPINPALDLSTTVVTFGDAQIPQAKVNGLTTSLSSEASARAAADTSEASARAAAVTAEASTRDAADTAEASARAAADTSINSAVALKAADSATVHNTGNETVAGTKTFSSAPAVPDNSFAESKVANLVTDLSAKAADSATVHNTGAESIAGVKTFSSAPAVPDNSFAESKVASLVTDLSAINSAIALKAADSATVHNTGSETIAGAKSFTGPGSFYSLASNSVVSTVLATPGAPTVTIVGTHGTTTWTYKIVAKLSDGSTTQAGAAGSTTTGDDNLDATNKISLAWSSVTGATSYDVYRTATTGTPSTTGKIANVSTNSYIDAGAAGDSSTAPTLNTTGRVSGAIADNGGQVFNVKAGANPAIGDGVTDDTAAIQARIDAAGLVGGCVFFPASNYRTTTLNVTGNVRLTGVDASTTGSTLSTVSNATLLNITAKCTVENLAFSGSINLNPTYTSQDLIVVTDTNDVYLRNLFVSHGYNNIRYQGTCFYCTLNQVRFYESKNAELRTAGSSSSGHQLQLTGCSVTGGGIRTNYVFLLDNVGSMMINGLLLNHSNTVNGGIIANTAANPGFGGFRITGSDIELEGGDGNGPALAVVGTSGFAFRNVQISNSYFGAANTAADRVIDLSYIYQSEFTNCIITGPNRGVKFLKAIDNITFSNCSFQTGDIPVISDGEQGTAHIDGVVFQGCHYTGPGAMFFLHPISAGNITVRDSAIGRTGPTIDIPAYNSGKTVRFSNCWGGDGTSNPQPYSQGPLTAPAVPATNTALQNPFLVPVTIYVSPGFANSFINNVSTGSSNTRIDLEPGQTVTLSYGSPITWTWFGR